MEFYKGVIMNRALVFLTLSVLLCGCSDLYRVQTPEGWREVTLDEALYLAETMEDIKNLRDQALWR